MITVGTLFSGGGLADVGYQAAGGELLWAIEHDAAIADVYRANLGDHIITASVLDIDPRTLAPVDLLHASPPCQAHSQARSKALGARDDADVGLDVLRYVACLLPRCVVIENVIPYRHSASCQALTAGLMELGYMVDCQNINSADYGIPQTRNRLIIRAVRDGWVPALQPTHGTKAQPWIGWYTAIADLIPTLPESHFASWQLARLGNLDTTTMVAHDMKDFSNPQLKMRDAEAPMLTVTGTGTFGRTRAFLVDGQTCDNGQSLTISPDGEPMITVSATMNHRMGRAFLMRSSNSKQEWSEPTRTADTPAMAITQGEKPKAFLVESKNANQRWGDGMRKDSEPATTVVTDHKFSHQPRAWLAQGRVVSMTPRALARFQSVPDWYVLPTKNSLACRIIGNAVPPLLSQRIAESLIPCFIEMEVAA